MSDKPRVFEIIEYDRDYHTITGREFRTFDSFEDAEEYCRKESWSGYDYCVANKPKARGVDRYE